MTPKDNIPSFLTHFGPYKQCMYDVQKTPATVYFVNSQQKLYFFDF